MKPELSLDVDGVLANSKAVVFDEMGEPHNPEKITSWEWPIHKFGADKFLGAFDRAWTDRWEEIEPFGSDVAETVEELANYYDVRIVTAQPDSEKVTDGKRNWMRKHGIGAWELKTVSREDSKANLRYDVYVDDKPTLPTEVLRFCPDDTKVFLRDHPYNQEAGGEFTRISAISDVLEYTIKA